jgi:O-succinylbenzoate synthase
MEGGGVMDLFQEAINRLVLKVSENRDKAILAALEREGHTFPTRIDLVKFIESRCAIHVHGEKHTLFVDTKPILEWWDTVGVEYKDNTLTFIAGKEPK